MQLKQKESNEVIKTKVLIIISIEDIDDIMQTALEGAITLWCNDAKVMGDYHREYVHEQIARGGMLRLHNYIENLDYFLTKEKFLKGIELWVQKPVGCGCIKHSHNGFSFDVCCTDVIACDAIIQYALFGKVLYG